MGSVKFSPEGDIVVSCQNWRIKIWNLDVEHGSLNLLQDLGESGRKVSLSQDHLITCDMSAVRIFARDPGASHCYEKPPIRRFHGNPETLTTVVALRSAPGIGMSSDRGGNLMVWDLNTGCLLQHLRLDKDESAEILEEVSMQ